MSKRIKKILRDIILILILGSMVRVLLIDRKMIITDNIIPLQNTYHVAYYDGEYYYFDKGDKKIKSGIYKLNEKGKDKLVHETNEVRAIAANKDYIFIAGIDEIRKVSKEKEIFTVIEYDTDGISNFHLTDKYLYFLDPGINALDINTLMEIDVYENQPEDNLILLFKNRSNIFKKNNPNGLLLLNESYLSEENTTLMETEENKENFYFGYGNGAGLCIYKYDDQVMANEVMYTTEYYKFRQGNIYVCNDEILIVNQLYHGKESLLNSLYKVIINPHTFMSGGAEYFIEEEMYMHTEDCIDILERGTWKKIDRFKTEKGERIIYADDKKIITCKNKNYTEYNMEDFSINKEWTNNYIINEGVYHFELCMNKIFVYNEDFKLLDVIDVK